MRLEALKNKDGFIDKMEGMKRSRFEFEDVDFLSEYLISTLYRDVPRSIVREIISNAIDSHRRAKTKKKVEVFPPSTEQPIFVVKDYGVGMSLEDVERVYLRIGASTKRDSDDQIGGWGFGAKSPLAYGDFQIESVKDGRKISAFAYRDAERRLKFVYSDEPTDEEPGVKVTIPVALEDVRLFIRHIDFYAAFFAETMLVVGGKKQIGTLEREPRIGKSYMRARVDSHAKEKNLSSSERAILMSLIDHFEGFYCSEMKEFIPFPYVGVCGIPYEVKGLPTTRQEDCRILLNFENNFHLRPSPSRETLIENEAKTLLFDFATSFMSRLSNKSIRDEILSVNIKITDDITQKLRIVEKEKLDIQCPVCIESPIAIFGTKKQVYIASSINFVNDLDCFIRPRLINGKMLLPVRDAILTSREEFERNWGRVCDLSTPLADIGPCELYSRIEKTPKIISTVGMATDFLNLSVKVHDSHFKVVSHCGGGFEPLSYEKLPDRHPAWFYPYKHNTKKFRSPGFWFSTWSDYRKFLKYHKITQQEHQEIWSRRAFIWDVRRLLRNQDGYITEEEYFDLKERVLEDAYNLFHSDHRSHKWIDILPFWNWICGHFFKGHFHEIADYLLEAKIEVDCSTTKSDLIPFTEDLRWVLESIDEVFDGREEFGIEPWYHESDRD